MATNAQITQMSSQRFTFENQFVTPRSKEREQRRLQRQVILPWAPKKPATGNRGRFAALKARSIELNALHAGCNPADAFKMTEEYNRWHTLDDHLDYGALLRGIHNIQERGGTGADEELFLNTVTDHFGHKRFDLGA